MVAPIDPEGGRWQTVGTADHRHERLSAALWTAPAPVVVTDAGGTICFVNAVFALMLATKASDLVDRPFLSLVQPDDRGLLARRIRAVSKGEPTRDLLVRVQTDRLVLPCLVGGSVVGPDGPGSRLLWVVVRPSMWSSEPGPSEVTDVAVALSRLALSRPAGLAPLRRVGQAASWCREVTGDGSEVGLVVWGHQGGDLVASTSETAQTWARAQLDSGQGPLVAASTANEVVRTPDLGGDPRYPDLPSGVPPGHSAVSAPVTVDGSVAGSLTVYDARPGLLSAEDIVVPSLAAATSAIAAQVRGSIPPS